MEKLTFESTYLIGNEGYLGIMSRLFTLLSPLAEYLFTALMELFFFLTNKTGEFHAEQCKLVLYDLVPAIGEFGVLHRQKYLDPRIFLTQCRKRRDKGQYG
jgi:hypothetical protein